MNYMICSETFLTINLLIVKLKVLIELRRVDPMLNKKSIILIKPTGSLSQFSPVLCGFIVHQMDGWMNAGSVLLYPIGSLIIFVPRLTEDPSSIFLSSEDRGFCQQYMNHYYLITRRILLFLFFLK